MPKQASSIQKPSPMGAVPRLGWSWLLVAGFCCGAGGAKAEARRPIHAPPGQLASSPAAAAPASGSAAASAPGGGAITSLDQLRSRLAERMGAKPSKDAYPDNGTVKVAVKAAEPAVTPTPRALPSAEAERRAPAAGHGTAAPPSPGAPTAKPPSATVSKAAAASPFKVARAGHGQPGHDVHWSYGGDGGPDAWAKLKPEFAACAVGQRQSPIDIRGGIAVELDPIVFDYRASGFSVIDNGHTIQVNLPPGNAISVGLKRFELLQFHFHRPSEERINGKQFDMVAHLVHKSAEGQLAVVAVLIERGAAQPLLQTIWSAIPLEKGEEVPSGASIDLATLLPKDRRYYTYMGSLTTPPCSEGVLWLVLKQPVPASDAQLGVFARLYPMNARPVQPSAGRLIKESN